jgi:hypothetical protein
MISAISEESACCRRKIRVSGDIRGALVDLGDDLAHLFKRFRSGANDQRITLIIGYGDHA